MKKNIIPAVLKNIILPSATLVIIAWFLRTFIGVDYFLKDSANFGWFLGVIGTIYTLITAFIIVQVWGQFNGLSTLLGKEAKCICSLWNFTDYLNDNQASRADGCVQNFATRPDQIRCCGHDASLGKRTGCL